MNLYAKRGLIFGLIATAVMTTIMLIGKATGMSPMPKPIPIAMVASIIGDAAKPVLMILGMLSHFAYGGVAGFILYSVLKTKGNILKALGFGVVLWLIMQLIVLPYLGWGIFGSSISPKIAVATLVLHLIYGAILGLGFKKLKTNASS